MKVVDAMIEILRLTAATDHTPPQAGVSTKPGDGVRVDLELRE